MPEEVSFGIVGKTRTVKGVYAKNEKLLKKEEEALKVLHEQEEEARKVERELEAQNKKLEIEADRRDRECQNDQARWREREREVREEALKAANEEAQRKELERNLREAKEEAQRRERGMKLNEATRLKDRVQQTRDTIPNIIRNRENLLNVLSQEREEIEKLDSDILKCNISGGVAGAVGTAMAIGGAILAPFTAGISLAVSAVGAGIGVSGAIVASGAAIADKVISKKKQTIINDLLEKDSKFLKDFEDCCKDLKNSTYDLDLGGLTSNSIISLPRDVHTVVANAIKKYKGNKNAISTELLDIDNRIKNELKSMEAMMQTLKKSEGTLDSLMTQLRL